MNTALLILFGFLLLIVQSAVTTVFPFPSFAPSLLLPIVIYLGVTPCVHRLRGSAISFALGYLVDSFCGNPMGPQTLAFTLTFMTTRFFGARLTLRGPTFQMGLTFAATFASGLFVVALRAGFATPNPISVGALGIGALLVTTATSSFVTALVSPVVLLLVRAIDQVAARRTDERAGLR